MKYDYSLGIFGNIQKLYTERNKANSRIDNTNSDISVNQAETDEITLDHEERIILLEVE